METSVLLYLFGKETGLSNSYPYKNQTLLYCFFRIFSNKLKLNESKYKEYTFKGVPETLIRSSPYSSSFRFIGSPSQFARTTLLVCITFSLIVLSPLPTFSVATVKVSDIEHEIINNMCHVAQTNVTF